MPSVASVASAMPSSHSHSPSAQGHSGPDNKPMDSPFALLLDSADPSAKPDRSQPRGERAERGERTVPSNDRGADASASAREGAESKDGKECASPKGDPEADGGNGNVEAEGGKGSVKADGDIGIVETDGNSEAGQPKSAKIDTAGPEPIAATTADEPPNTDGTAENKASDTNPAFGEALPAPTTADVAAVPANPNPNPSAAHDVPEAEHAALQAIGARTVPDRKGDAPAAQNTNAKNDAAPHDTPAAPAAEAGSDSNDGGAGKETSNKSHLPPGEPADKPSIEATALKQRENLGAAFAGTDTAPLKTSSEVVQNLGTWAPTAHVNATANLATTAVTNGAALPQAAAMPLAGLAVEIATQARAGKHRFEIRLDPPELGRIDVRLDIDRDGQVTSRLVADRGETLDLLKRDAAQLERALQQAGLKTSDHSLEFSLRQQAFTRDDTGGQSAASTVVPEEDPAPLEAMRQGYGRLLGLGGGLDIRV